MFESTHMANRGFKGICLEIFIVITITSNDRKPPHLGNVFLWGPERSLSRRPTAPCTETSSLRPEHHGFTHDLEVAMNQWWKGWSKLKQETRWKWWIRSRMMMLMMQMTSDKWLGKDEARDKWLRMYQPPTGKSRKPRCWDPTVCFVGCPCCHSFGFQRYQEHWVTACKWSQNKNVQPELKVARCSEPKFTHKDPQNLTKCTRIPLQSTRIPDVPDVPCLVGSLVNEVRKLIQHLAAFPVGAWSFSSYLILFRHGPWQHIQRGSSTGCYVHDVTWMKWMNKWMDEWMHVCGI